MNDEHDKLPPLGTEPDGGDGREIVLPLFTEELTVSKRVVTTGRLQVSRVTRQRDELVDKLLAREYVEIERTPIDRPIETTPAIREEGDTLVIPIVEEVLVTERRLVLKEEVRIRKWRETERYQERVMLRRQEATITRLPIEESAVREGD